ncbi:MAG TPA: hypothetical protein VF753_17130 [Terriglobales bacterium]
MLLPAPAGSPLPRSRDRFLSIIEQTRGRYRFVVVGYVVMSEQWRWSSYRHCFLGEAGSVPVNVGWPEISFRDHVASVVARKPACMGSLFPPLQKRKERGTHNYW